MLQTPPRLSDRFTATGKVTVRPNRIPGWTFTIFSMRQIDGCWGWWRRRIRKSGKRLEKSATKKSGWGFCCCKLKYPFKQSKTCIIVQTLVEFIRKRDKRVTAYRKLLEEQRKDQQAKVEAQRLCQKMKNLKLDIFEKFQWFQKLPSCSSLYQSC